MKFFCDPSFPVDKIRPLRATEYACGFDLAAAITEPVMIGSGVTEISTGVKLEIPQGVGTLLMPRSSAGNPDKAHFGLHLANTLGLIDCDYRGYLLLKVYVPGGFRPITIRPYDRIAQMVLFLHPFVDLEQVSDEQQLTKTVRGSGAYGHTGS